MTVDPPSALIKAAFRWVDGHADLWAVFSDPAVLRQLGPSMAAPSMSSGVTAVLAVEARGFIVGPLVAVELDARFVPVRKGGGLLSGRKAERTSGPDYRGNTPTFRVQRERLGPEDRVLLVDDWVETGHQLAAVAGLAEECGASVVGTSVVVTELAESQHPFGEMHALVRANDLE